MKLQVISGWSSVLVENGVAGEEITFYPNMVQARKCGLSYAMDTTDACHTYRLVFKDKSFQVLVDGQLRIDGKERLTSPAWNGRSGMAFGAANSPGVGEALWESVKLRCGTVSVQDLALSIRYGG